MTALSVSICIITCVAMILGVLIFPTIKLGKLKLASYWVITLLGATLLVVILLIANEIDIQAVGNALIADTAINPIKILVLFLSMTILSIFLDELKFFRYLASATLKRAKSGQIKLFLYLYLIVSVLTVFTSNDVIILSFTPFICYFAKNAKINPTPYLAAEFVAANTWSMALIIGNPTNIYLATANGIDFLSYLEVSILPTLAAGIVAFIALFLLYRKKLSDPIDGEAEEVVIEDKFLFWVGIVHLAVCTILLAIGSYIGLEMWIVALSAVGSLFLFTLITSAVRKTPPVHAVPARSVRAVDVRDDSRARPKGRDAVARELSRHGRAGVGVRRVVLPVRKHNKQHPDERAVLIDNRCAACGRFGDPRRVRNRRRLEHRRVFHSDRRACGDNVELDTQQPRNKIRLQGFFENRRYDSASDARCGARHAVDSDDVYNIMQGETT